jgi:diguanylate cyclase (GGDEF)-like protein/PAS domain S-box-containing protein
MGKKELACRCEFGADEGLFEALVRNAFGVIAVLDDEGSLRFINQTVERFLGYPPRQLLGWDVEELMRLIHPADLPTAREALNKVLKKPGKLVRTELRVRHAAGVWLWMEAAFQNLLQEDSVRGIVVNVRDISERKRAEATLRESEERFRALVQCASDLIAVLEPDGEVRYLSPGVKRVLGCEPEEWLGRDAFEHLHPDDAERVSETFARLLERPGSTTTAVEFRMRHEDGSWRYLGATATNLTDNPSVKGIVVNASDVTERRKFEEQLRHRAFHDSLTGLPNRALFIDRLGHALVRVGRSECSVAVLFLDLDNFKLVNDSLGHETGDELLVRVAERLRASSRSGDTVARFGGDEFAVLLEDVEDKGEATRAALRIGEKLRSPFVLERHEVFVTPSIGVALGLSTGNTVEDFLRSADRAMYRAKNSSEVYSLDVLLDSCP